MSETAINRSSTIAGAISGALFDLSQALDGRNKAADVVKGIDKEVGNAREDTMGVLAELAADGEWSITDIDTAVAHWAKANNTDNKLVAKSLETFVGEAKRAMHPHVRQDYADLRALRDAVWEAEDAQLDADPKHPAPVRAAFSRKYHLLVTMMGAQRDGTPLTTVGQVVSFAVKAANAKKSDPKRAFKALEKARAELQVIATMFPETDLASAMDLLNKVTKAEQLAAAYDEANAGLIEDDGSEAPNDTAAAPAPTVVAGDDAASADTVVSGGVEAAEGAVDILAELDAEMARAA